MHFAAARTARTSAGAWALPRFEGSGAHCSHGDAPLAVALRKAGKAWPRGGTSALRVDFTPANACEVPGPVGA